MTTDTTTTPDRSDWTYQPSHGHPTWHHWNVYLWISNDYASYRAAADNDLETFRELYRSYVTPDGGEATDEILEYVWEALHDDEGD